MSRGSEAAQRAHQGGAHPGEGPQPVPGPPAGAGPGRLGRDLWASCGWFAHFKVHHSLHSLGWDCEARRPARRMRASLRRCCSGRSRRAATLPRVGNVDEPGLFWKQPPDKTFLFMENKSVLGFKATRDTLMLLLSGNAAGDFKLKPLLVYPSENPRAQGPVQAQSVRAVAFAQEGLGGHEPLPGVVPVLLSGCGDTAPITASRTRHFLSWIVRPATPGTWMTSGPCACGVPAQEHHGPHPAHELGHCHHLQGLLPSEGLPPAGGTGRGRS